MHGKQHCNIGCHVQYDVQAKEQTFSSNTVGVVSKFDADKGLFVSPLVPESRFDMILQRSFPWISIRSL